MRLILFCLWLVVAGIPSISCAGFDERVAELKALAQQGDAEAQHQLGEWYDVGYLQPHSEAFKWYRLAANQGHTRSMTNLGGLYAEGSGSTQDYREAVQWYRKAADRGDADAQDSLARCYRDGRGVPQNYKEAATWYRKAARQGFPSGQWHLGRLYRDGRGIQKNVVVAYAWLDLAAGQQENGLVALGAAEDRDKLAKTLSPKDLIRGRELSSAWKVGAVIPEVRY